MAGRNLVTRRLNEGLGRIEPRDEAGREQRELITQNVLKAITHEKVIGIAPDEKRFRSCVDALIALHKAEKLDLTARKFYPEDFAGDVQKEMQAAEDKDKDTQKNIKSAHRMSPGEPKEYRDSGIREYFSGKAGWEIG